MKSETELIRRITALSPAAAAHQGDDMAWLDPSQPGLLWSVDMLMDGVDFESHRHRWEDVGWKALAVNLSDCAAMAARPLAALVAVALCDTLTMDDALALHRGAAACGAEFDCPLVGGDTNSWASPTVVSITIAARMDSGWPPVRRSGGRPGDTLWLTGRVGGSLGGRHLRCTPRVREALAWRPRLNPRAMIDISDGLARDLGRLCEASGCGALLPETELAALVHPDAIAQAALDGRTSQDHALYDGEDFELIVALPPETAASEARAAGLLPLGVLVAESGVFLADPDGRRREVELRGWEHFR